MLDVDRVLCEVGPASVSEASILVVNKGLDSLQPKNQEAILVTVKDVSKLLGVSVRTVNRWFRTDEMPPPVKTPGRGYRRWKRRDIEIWVAAGCTKRGWRRAKGK